jgi:hypothetical protein
MDTILLTLVSLAAVALIAWMLAAGVESGLRHHQRERDDSEADAVSEVEKES